MKPTVSSRKIAGEDDERVLIIRLEGADCDLFSLFLSEARMDGRFFGGTASTSAICFPFLRVIFLRYKSKKKNDKHKHF